MNTISYFTFIFRKSVLLDSRSQYLSIGRISVKDSDTYIEKGL